MKPTVLSLSFFVVVLALYNFSGSSADCQNGIIAGQLNWEQNGATGITYVAQSGGTNGGISTSGSSLKLNHNSRAYLAANCSTSFVPNLYQELQLLDKTLSFTVDLSQAGCGCNAAFYTVEMPAYNQNQQPDPTRCGDYYCDANNVCGLYCPEMDIMEANNQALQITPHSCSAPQGRYYSQCDGGGCAINIVHQDPSSYGYGSNYEINTQYPFNVSTTFTTSGGQLSEITSVISQNSNYYKVVHDSSCGASYLPSMTDSFNQGMVVVFSYWGDAGSEMSWLDVPPCDASQSCNDNTFVTFSNIQIN